MERDGPERGRRLPFAWGNDGCRCRQKGTRVMRPDILPKVRFRDLISGAKPVIDGWDPSIACYTPPQEACVTTLRSRSLKQTERILYCARPLADSRGRRLGFGAGR
jgi:hypothetical protein